MPCRKMAVRSDRKKEYAFKQLTLLSKTAILPILPALSGQPCHEPPPRCMETALQFERATCRWTILGTAAEVYISNERVAVLRVLASAGTEGLAVSEIMAAT